MKTKCAPPANHCFSLYIPDEKWWKIQLAEKLAKKTHRKSVSSLLADLLDLALIDNNMMSEDGASLVKGIGPQRAPSTKKSILKKPVSLKRK